MFDDIIIINKINKDNLKKIITKKKHKKKHVAKHYSNPQCFVRKTTWLTPHNLALFVITCNYNSQSAQYQKNIKSTKIILEKNIKKRKKTMWGKHYINTQ
jgi:microcompartment protein CcmL/EutN